MQAAKCTFLLRPSNLSLLLELVDDGLLQCLRFRRARPATLDLAVASDEELLEVPLDHLEAHKSGLLFLEPLVDGAGLVAVDIDLLHDGERDTICSTASVIGVSRMRKTGKLTVDLAEVLDLIVGSGLLRAELVAREAEEDNIVTVLLLELLVQSLEAGVLRGEAALGGRVDDEDNLALVVGEVNLLGALCDTR